MTVTPIITFSKGSGQRYPFYKALPFHTPSNITRYIHKINNSAAKPTYQDGNFTIYKMGQTYSNIVYIQSGQQISLDKLGKYSEYLTKFVFAIRQKNCRSNNVTYYVEFK
jgi:hypothetical protein